MFNAIPPPLRGARSPNRLVQFALHVENPPALADEDAMVGWASRQSTLAHALPLTTQPVGLFERNPQNAFASSIVARDARAIVDTP
jgi:hypothetical protein